MAGNLVKSGFVVKGFDLNQETMDKCKDFVSFLFMSFHIFFLQGVEASKSTGEVARDVDYIVSSLPRTSDVDHVLHMDDGVFANASPNTMILDTSTISPIASKEFYATAKSKGMTWIDSPMSGGIMGAQNGTLTFMVGALESDPDYAVASLVL